MLGLRKVRAIQNFETPKTSTANRLNLNIIPTRKELYAFGETNKAAVISDGMVRETVKLDYVKVNNLCMLVVLDHAQAVDAIIGRNFADLPQIAYVKIGETLQFGYSDNEPFASMELNGNTDEIRLYATENVKLKMDTVNFIQVKGEYEGEWPVVNRYTQDVHLDKGECVCVINENVGERKVIELGEDIILTMLNIDTTVSRKDSYKLLELIREYRDCFAMNI